MLALAALPAAAHAADPSTAETIDVSRRAGLDRFDKTVKLQLRKVARMIDGFFSDAEYDAQQNDSGLRLSFDTDYETPDDFDFRFVPRLHLRLSLIRVH